MIVLYELMRLAFSQLAVCCRDLSMPIAVDLLLFFNSITLLNFLFSDLDARMPLVFTSLYIHLCFAWECLSF